MKSDQSDSAMSFKPKILVVDDEKRIRDGCHNMLVKDGFQVAQADSGNKGIQRIEKEHFDIILLDLMMPGLSGMETLSRIRTVHPDTVVIIITGYATVEHAIEAMKNGAFDFLSKPFSPQDLQVVIAKAVKFIETLQDIATEKSRMHMLINQLGDGVMATDSHKRVALANPAFLRRVGHRGGTVVGQHVSEWVKDTKLLRMIDEALAMPKDKFMELSEEIETDNGESSAKKIFNARCVPFKDRLGRNIGSVTVLHDVTALKEMDRMKSDFVSMLAHEIQSPMNTVLMQMKVISDGLAGPLTNKQQDILKRTSQIINSLSDLSSDLLDLAKIESGLITMEKASLDLADLLSNQVAFHQTRADKKNITLELEPLPDLPLLFANRVNLEEVLSNLITNAIAYSSEGGRVSISAGRENDWLCIRVRDTGIGISPEDVKHIFKRFYRVKNEKTRHIKGTGLGLSIVKRIIEAHHGSIEVTSIPGKGSTFTVYLPLLSSH